jgi:SPP1 family predicted phage head-tail adaptor
MADYLVKLSDLNTRITLQQPVITTDAGAAQIPGWANAANPVVWSKWTYDHGQELIKGDASVSVARATVDIRFRNDVLSAWQVVQEDGSIWKLIAPPENVQNRRQWLVLRVERVKGSV